MTAITLISYYKQLLTFFGKCDKNIFVYTCFLHSFPQVFLRSRSVTFRSMSCNDNETPSLYTRLVNTQVRLYAVYTCYFYVILMLTFLLPRRINLI